MLDKNDYKAAFSKVTASGETYRRVMNMTKENNNEKRIPGRRLAVLVAAVMALMAVTVTAFAAVNGAGWFQDFFSRRSEADLSEGQAAYIQEETRELKNSVTHNGYTLTVESAITDGSVAYLNLKLEGPEGTALDADGYGYTYKMKSVFYPADGSNPSRTGSWQTLDDENKQDNSVNILFVGRIYEGSFATGSEWRFEVEDLMAEYELEDGSYKDEVIAEGVFGFNLVLSDSGNREVELLTRPLPYKAKIYETDSEYTTADIQLTSIILRPLSATITIKNLEDAYTAAGFGQMSIVMKDGSTVSMSISSGGNGKINYAMKAPIAFDEVEHLLLPDGTKVAMPDCITE